MCREAIGGSVARRDQGEDLVVLREAALALLREDDRPVRHDVVLALLALERGGLVARSLQHGRETRGPAVVAVSDRAVEDLDAHAWTVPHGRGAVRSS